MMPDQSQSMAGKICMVTGANSGIGKVTALELCRSGAHTVMVCRDSGRGEQAATEVRRATGRPDAVELMLADFAKLDQVRALAQAFSQRHQRLDVLVNNAGLMLNRRHQTVDGLEHVLCVNHLSPFLLTNLLLGQLEAAAPSRVVNVASEAHWMGQIDFDDLQLSSGPYIGLPAYGRTKLANILFTRELARRLEGTGVTANALHPGVISSGFGRETRGTFNFLIKLARPFMSSPEKGARTSLYLATSPEVATVTGAYFVNRRQATPSAAARDDVSAQRLWDVSRELVGLDGVSD